MAGRGLRGRAAGRTRAALGHALAFPTWRSLAREQGLRRRRGRRADVRARRGHGRRSLSAAASSEVSAPQVSWKMTHASNRCAG